MAADLKLMTEWYAKVIGFHVSGASNSPIPSAYLTNDTVHHRGGLFTAPGLVVDPPSPRVGINHIAFAYETIDDLLESWERLKRIGIEAIVMTCHGTHWAFYYKDPENNTVELLAEAYADPADALSFQGSPEYAANPMGCAVDAQMLIEARKAGASLDELRERTMAGEFTPESYAGAEALI